ncbi:hypothetical protein BD410DRAFT_710621 [Rickenella mellea]|uniref:Uncharacterized protein n=1 Tax=Rickenella mellea TaxID=50990 RepID=A0A4R5XDH1_9AGAM|nr:hypothetical protein BD410DRAFT_710621 [Rickenella mellea]
MVRVQSPGQGLLRLLQFSGHLASENKPRLQLSYWENLVKEYFTSKAVMKLTLWKDNQRNEAKPFDIGVPILPRFFLITSQSGVKSMTLSLDGASERHLGQGHTVVECVGAVWTYKYNNGYTVTLRGPLTAHVFVVPRTPTPQNAGMPLQQQQPFTLKFDGIQFDANLHEKSLMLDSISGQRLQDPQTPRQRHPATPNMTGTPKEDDRKEESRIYFERGASIPTEPVNAFGIPQATMRCLEVRR